MKNNIKINEEIYLYLKHELFEKGIFENYNVNDSDVSNIIISVDDDDVIDIQEWAIEKQLFLGLDMNYELTNEGKLLQKIIDAFNI